jgi:hypothetical protein
MTSSLMPLMLRASFVLLALFVVGPGRAVAQGILLDDFESIEKWKLIVSEGVSGSLQPVDGAQGKALGFRFAFHGRAGYAIAQRAMPIHLPARYRFTFVLRGSAGRNNFEFKLLDSAGNVYWLKTVNLVPPKRWQKRTIRQRQITYAWGPAGGGSPGTIDRMEFAVSAGNGGSGEIAIDELRLEIDDEKVARALPVISSSSARGRESPAFATGDSVLGPWHSAGTSNGEWILMDFGGLREIGGVILEWEKEDYARSYRVELSEDGKNWRVGYRVRESNGGRDVLPLRDEEARFLQLSMRRSASGGGFGLARMVLRGPEFSASWNAFYASLTEESPPGVFPKYLSHRMSNWTVVGASGDDQEALINEEGMVEVGKGEFSLEPFLYFGGHLITWQDVGMVQSLEDGYLPIPTVRWSAGPLALNIRAFAAGPAGKSVLILTYTLENRGVRREKGSLFLALRPFQVNPPAQFLNLQGGVTTIRSLRYDGDVLIVNGSKRLFPLKRPSSFGATGFDGGDITEYLQRGQLPPEGIVQDHSGHASGALQYEFDLPPQRSAQVSLALPFHRDRRGLEANLSERAGRRVVARRFDETRQFWRRTLNAVQIHLPPEAEPVMQTVRSNLAYILINRDGRAIQPGSRSYARSWIRDGALTASALCMFGRRTEAREFVEWYSTFQSESGRVPSVVDARGADPVPEHDSPGELIFAIAEVFRSTEDTAWLAKQFPHVEKAVRFLQALRAERKTMGYLHGSPVQRACYGLLPESISHEGYSAKPMHSYWDDFFALRGLKDAAALARMLGKEALARSYAEERDDMRSCLYASMRRAMENARIDYIPGCVELGDFDATSTSIGVSPGGELGFIPEPQLHRTFDRYYGFFSDRASGALRWQNYTPYEVRIIGTMVRLGERDRANELLNYFLRDRRPPGWNGWAEVVWRDSTREAFIGDMPHSWVGSEFLRSFRSMLVYERERDTALVIGGGIPSSWVLHSPGVSVAGLPTAYGQVSFRLQGSGNAVTATISGPLHLVPGGVRLISPLDRPLRKVLLNGRPIEVVGEEIPISQLPANIQLQY